MYPLLILSGLFVLAYAAGAILRDLVTRKRDLLSMRNMFLLGMAFFYGSASVIYGFTGAGPYSPEGSGPLLLAVLIPVFIVCFILGEKILGRSTLLSRLLPPAHMTPSTPGLIVTIGIMIVGSIGALLAGSGGSAVGVGYSYGGVLALNFRAGLATAGMGLATYFLLAKRFNPMAWGVFLTALASTTVVTLAAGTGRRAWLGVMVVIPWVWYYATLRYKPITRGVLKIAVPGAAGLFFLFVYSGVRHEYGKRDKTAMDQIQVLKEMAANPAITAKATTQVLVQDTPMNTVFVLETYGSAQDHAPLEGLVYVLATPIPRSVWQDYLPGEKPNALGIIIQDLLRAPANLGPGIIAHGWYEAAFVGVVYYALFFGAFVGILDRALAREATNPYFVAVMGSALGNVIALPRGDTPLFLVQILAGWFAAYVVFYGIKILMGSVFAGFPALEVAPPINEDWDGEEYDYGSEESPDPSLAVA